MGLRGLGFGLRDLFRGLGLNLRLEDFHNMALSVCAGFRDLGIP